MGEVAGLASRVAFQQDHDRFRSEFGAEMARSEGLEPPTFGFEARRSIQLS